MQAYFTIARSGSGLDPLPSAVSGWDPDLIRGPAIAGALVRAAESLPLPEGMRLARVAFEFFRPSRMRTSVPDAAIIRQGRRLTVIDASLQQAGRVTARAQLMYAAAGPEATGMLWSADTSYASPDDELSSDPEGRLYRCDQRPWTRDARAFDNGLHKQIWQRPFRIVDGEDPSPAQLAAACSDLTNLVVHAGDHGVEHINADAHMTLVRPPSPSGIGVAATQRLTHDGVSVGSAVLFDADGAFGITTVAALSNVEHAVVRLPGGS